MHYMMIDTYVPSYLLHKEPSQTFNLAMLTLLLARYVTRYLDSA